MKKLKFLAVCALFTIFGMQKTDAQSDVYIFWDCKAQLGPIPIEVNGAQAIILNPELSKSVYGYNVYKKAARKVTFPEAGRYNLSSTVEMPGIAIFHAEMVLNLEDGETYYVLLNSKTGNLFYFTEMSEKDGQKFLEKARKDKNYTFNEDFTYIKE